MYQQTVLLVEDDSTVATFLNRILEHSGYRVLSAANGSDAIGLGRLHQDEIGLVVCDIQLKRESGAAVAAQLREFCPGARVLFISGYSLDILVERRLLDPALLQTGSAFFLPKPFLAHEFLREVERILAIEQAPSVDLIPSWRTIQNALAIAY